MESILNDPDQRRVINLSNRVASDFGAIVSPTDEAMENADRQFLENLQAQIQAAFQSNQENVDRNALQRLFGFMQQWPNLPKSLKVKEIARSGMYDFEFSESSSQSKITLDGQADRWGFLPMHINHPRINVVLTNSLKSLDPRLANDENRTRALQFVGQRHGFSARDVETILYSQFRALQVDQTYSQGGLALSGEAELDLHGEQFAWDAELIAIEVDDLNISDPAIAVITLTDKSKAGSSVTISYSNRKYEFQLRTEDQDKNGSLFFVKLGDDLTGTALSLKEAIDKEEIGLLTKVEWCQHFVFPEKG